MSIRRLRFFIFSIFLLVSIIEYLPGMIPVRLFGTNILNERIWQALVAAIILLTDSRGYASPSMLIIYFWIAVFVLFEGFGHYIVGYGLESNIFAMLRSHHLSIAVIVLMHEHLRRNSDTKMQKKLLKIAVIAYSIQCVINTIIIIRNPSIVRGVDWAGFVTTAAFGAGSYAFYTSLPFLIPGIVYLIKEHQNNEFFKRGWAIGILGTIIVGSYMGVIVAPFLISV